MKIVRNRFLFPKIIDAARRRLCSRYYTQIALDKSSTEGTEWAESRRARVYCGDSAALSEFFWHLQDTRDSSRRYARHACWRASLRVVLLRLVLSSLHFSLRFSLLATYSRIVPLSLSCGRELLLSNDMVRRTSDRGS